MPKKNKKRKVSKKKVIILIIVLLIVIFLIKICNTNLMKNHKESMKNEFNKNTIINEKNLILLKIMKFSLKKKDFTYRSLIIISSFTLCS